MERINFNVREICECSIKIQKRDWAFGWFPSKSVEECTPTHVRFISSEVPAGLFSIAQPKSEFESELVRTGPGMLQLPGARFMVLFVN